MENPKNFACNICKVQYNYNRDFERRRKNMNQANKKALISYYYEGLSLEHAIEIIEHGGYTKIDQATIKAACNTIINCTGIDWTTVKEYHDPYTEQLDAYFGK